MADFKTTLERLSRQEIEFESVARNIDKLLRKKPHAAVAVMDQLKEAVTEDVIDAEMYGRLRARVAAHLEAAPAGGEDEQTVFANDDTDAGDIFDVTGSGHSSDVAAADDATQMLDDHEDATQVLDGTAAATPMSGATTGIDFDLTSDAGSRTSSDWPTGSDQTGQTGTDWAQPDGGGSTTKLGPGAVLRGRFKLDEVLGVGGMGSVYLGSDLIKVRAKDKQPRVALKVLNEDFKQHPDSFIALQREASRQQKLAHPNIATVYDFDQTEDGLAFLVMELLEGQPLNDFIKKVVKPKGGLPFDEAYPMVEGLGNALIYAHDRNIVHSDFKPGNCFITKEGQMKVLDFGIARAVKAPGAAEGETTIFDPGKLGALTPAYASVEMLEGEEPDTRDDIYALACVAYELLTGKHPFNKIPANKARDSGLVPEPIKTISRKQWRGLERGLAFAREDRSQSTAEFLEQFEGATSPFRNPFIMGPAIAALIALAGVFPAMNYFEEQDVLERIELAQGGDKAGIESVLAGLDAGELGDAQRDRVLTEAKDPILDYFDRTARALIDTGKGRYDFTHARLTLDKAKSYAVFADSSKLAELDEYIEVSENRVLAEQFDKFNLALEEGALTHLEGEDDIFDAMAIVEKVDPKHAILADPRIPGAYANAINAALENDDYEYANELSDLGLGLMANNQNLINLQDKIAGAKDRAETTARILAAIAAIQAVADVDGGLEDYAAIGDRIADLAAADPGNELLTNLREKFAPAAERDIAALEDKRAWGQSRVIGGDYKGLLRGLGLHRLTARAEALAAEYDPLVGTARAAVTAAVAADDLDPQAAERLAAMRKLAPHDARTANAAEQIGRAWLRDAQAARAGGDFAAAAAALEKAGKLSDDSSFERAVADELARVEAADDGADLASGFDAAAGILQQTIATLDTDAGAYGAALRQLAELEVMAPANPGLPSLRADLAAAVRRGARALGNDGQWNAAVDVTRETLVYVPGADDLSAGLAGLEAERKAAIAEQEKQMVAEAKQTVDRLLAENDPVADRDWRTRVRSSLETVAALGEPDDPWLLEAGSKAATIYVARAASMRADQRFAEGANLLADAERFGPETPGLAAEREALDAATAAFEAEQQEQARLARIEGLKQTFEIQARANDVAKAARTLEALKAESGDAADAFVTNEAPRLLASGYFRLATNKAEAKDFAAALKFAQACQGLQPNKSECREAVRSYTVSGNKQTLDQTFSRGGEFDLADALTKVSELRGLNPGVFGESETSWAQAVADRLEQLKEAAGTGANDLIEQAKEVFVGNDLIAAIGPVSVGGGVAPSQFAAQVNAAMEKALLTEARDLLKQANRVEPEHPDIVTLKGRYNASVREAKSLYDAYKEQYRSGDLNSALKTMETALDVWADSSTFKKEHARVVAKLSATTSAGEGGVLSEATKIPDALPPTNPCEARLAGHGKRKKGTCFYFIAGNQRGPMMVVVPQGEGFEQPFAIGKYEITVSDYNRYCRLSRSCEPVSGQEGRLPVTGISIEQAEAYVQWLSTRTGLRFRLPTVAEWSYAASAGGQQPKKDYNCRVEQNGQILKGQGTMGVNTGKANGWGLYNYIGNVQEWARDGSGVVARGGAFEDVFSKCEIALEKPHNGSADGATGFRVLLELGPAS